MKPGGVKDKRSNQDDVLFGLVFAYICDETFAHRQPIDKEVKRAQARVKYISFRGSQMAH
jgi:hypothetical protein